VPWQLFAILGAGGGALIVRALARRSQQGAAAQASGLSPAPDLTHLPEALQRTALWSLSDGGFERRVVHGQVPRERALIDVTAFDLEPLRERRGEWAFLPVEPPFRIGGVVSIVACELDRSLPHILLKHAGAGDRLADDDLVTRASNIAKQVRDGLGVARKYAAELPKTLPVQPLAVALPPEWRAYAHDAAPLTALLAGGLHAALARSGRRDLVVELIDSLVVIYPASVEVVGPDALADLTTTALALVDGIRAVPHDTKL